MIRDHERIARIRRALEAHGLDAVVCGLRANVLLLSGYWPVIGSALAVATRQGAVALVVPADEADLASHGWADAIAAPLTLVYSSRDEEHNQVVVLKEYLQAKRRRRPAHRRPATATGCHRVTV